ncbi:GNAT family N-acetyltransferase [Rubrolithibacter danxiaensis]|uniref:GNAT family N-acetyltransferase n=1 Tax=Rubrolithibacter danxiaensis TaxID=3390805 RepID=UPI003BF82A16
MNLLFTELPYYEENIINKIKNLFELNSVEQEISFYSMFNNFDSYLINILEGDENRIFYATCVETEKIVGFISIKINDTVFLNALVVDKQYSQLQIGSFLLVNSLSILRKQFNLSDLEVEVFEKNKKIFSWYLELGMEILNCKYWYDITSYFKRNGNTNPSVNKNDNVFFQISKINKGISELIYLNKSIATLIDSKCLVFKTDIDYNLLQRVISFFNNLELSTVCLVSKRELALSLIDKSFYLRGALAELKFFQTPV